MQCIDLCGCEIPKCRSVNLLRNRPDCALQCSAAVREKDERLAPVETVGFASHNADGLELLQRDRDRGLAKLETVAELVLGDAVDSPERT